jgi:hypothetical protein
MEVLMTPTIENILVLLLVAAAVAYVIVRFRRMAAGRSKCVCGTSACGSAAPPCGSSLPVISPPCSQGGCERKKA